jgi:hypothetical protein
MTATASRPAGEELLRFCGLDGQYVVRQVQGEHWGSNGDGGAQIRLIRLGSGGPTLLQKAVPAAAGQVFPVVYDRLENEIRCGVRLAERYERAYPPELFRLVGYNFDLEVPYVLMEPPRGRPVGDLAGKLLLEEQQRFTASLLRALWLLEEAGVVHDGLHPGAVFWDGTQVQLFEFGLSAMIGEPGRETASGPWAAPERRMPGNAAERGDDVWSAGMIIYYVVTGRLVSQAAGIPDLDVRGGLRRLLDGVFVPTARLRPTAADLLLRARVGAVAPVAEPPVRAGFEEGLEEFDRVRSRKHGPVRAMASVDPVRRRRRRKVPWALLIMVLLLVAAGAVYALNRR